MNRVRSLPVLPETFSANRPAYMRLALRRSCL